MCIRGLRSRSKHLCVPPAVDLAVDKRHLSPLEQGDPYLNGMVFSIGYANFLSRSLKSGTVPLYLKFL